MKTSIYIAASLDGFIATHDHGLDWLNIVKSEGEDYGYADFMSSVDCLLIGRNTYETVRGFGAWPYEGKRVLVLTHRPFVPMRDETQVSGSLRSILQKLTERGIQRVYLDGGATARQGLAERVVTDITVSIIPILLGGGISLFGEIGIESRLRHLGAKSFSSGLVQLSYTVQT
jgi:dihydrofolate reductase